MMYVLTSPKDWLAWKDYRQLSAKLSVGNLEAKRAITDVRDVIVAFDLALNKATIGESYNLMVIPSDSFTRHTEILQDWLTLK